MTDFNDRAAYRCAVAPEVSAAKLKVRGKAYDVNVVETSRSGFTIAMNSKIARKITKNQPCLLEYSGERWELLQESEFNEGKGRTKIGFSRQRDLTKMKASCSMGLGFTPTISTQADPTFLFFVVIALLVACLSLPGIGDSLGTAPKVDIGVKSLVSAVSDASK